jgi:XXXCH domain-containing protein
MSDKTEKVVTRAELADYLEKMAGDLRAGSLKVADKTWKIPDNVSTKIRFKEKSGRLVTKLSWQWSTLDDYSDQEREKTIQRRDALKTIKKRMSVGFKSLIQAVESGVLPRDGMLEEFEKASSAFALLADPEWKEALEEYTDHLANLKRAIAEKQLEAVRHELRDLKHRMKACHREFK